MCRSRWDSSNPRTVAPGFVALNVYGPPEMSQTQRVRMNFKPGEPCQLLGVPLAEGRVVGSPTGDLVLDDLVAEMVDHRRDREDATEALVQALLGHRPVLV